MDRSFFNLPIKLCIVLALSAVCPARADEALPSQDQALARALENHPDIVAAKAKVALAEAELYGKRIEVSRQVLGLYGNLKRLESQVDVAKAALDRSKLSAEKGGVPAVAVQTAEAELMHAINHRGQMEKELRLLIGTASPAAAAIPRQKSTGVPRQAPQGPIIEQIKVAKDKPIKLEFVDTPMEEVMAYLTSTTGLMFSLQLPVLEDSGFSAGDPISLQTNEVPLHAALQAFEDAYPGMQFILRDYGVLLTTKEYAKVHGYTPVLEPSQE
jgi:hypothetical protein